MPGTDALRPPLELTRLETPRYFLGEGPAWSEETGARRIGAATLARLQAPDARERYEFNLRLMAGRTDLDLGLTPDVPGTPGLLPLEIGRVERVVGHLGMEATTALALRVLTGEPASVGRA